MLPSVENFMRLKVRTSAGHIWFYSRKNPLRNANFPARIKQQPARTVLQPFADNSRLGIQGGPKSKPIANDTNAIKYIKTCMKLDFESNLSVKTA